MKDGELRCCKCSMFLQEMAAPVLLAMLFKRSRLGARDVPRVHPQEMRVLCKRCRWTNVFVPAAIDTQPIEVKTAV